MSSELYAIGPVDGRYRKEVEDLANYFSEFALIKERINVEVRYLIFISRLIGKEMDKELVGRLQDICCNFDLKEAVKVKRLEAKFDHDVKAIEVYLGGLASGYAAYVHFGLTSEDTNNLAYGRLYTSFLKEVYLPTLKNLIVKLAMMAERYAGSPMLGRTHGQPASPTTIGKEVGLYAYRLAKAFKKLLHTRISGKLNGAVGNFNALAVAYPQIDWINVAREFIVGLGLEPELFTTQILPYDCYIEVFSTIAMINALLINLCRDVWMYYSFGYISLSSSKSSIGSSTMPHKVNPKDFENCEGNLKIANSLLLFYANELLANRLQRDLSDSTIRRSFGVAMAHSILAYRRLVRALDSVVFREDEAMADLRKHGEIFSEALQTILRREGIEDAYFKVLEKVKGKRLTVEEIRQVASTFNLPAKILDEFNRTIQQNYLGLAHKLAESMVQETIKIIDNTQ